jgi:hypothetical protein
MDYLKKIFFWKKAWIFQKMDFKNMDFYKTRIFHEKKCLFEIFKYITDKNNPNTK